MNTVVCTRLDGNNPLHFLAALGLLRLVSLTDPRSRLSWLSTAPYSPVVHSDLAEAEAHRAIVGHLGIRGTVALQTRRCHLKRNLSAAEVAQAACARDKAGRRQVRELREQAKRAEAQIKRIDVALAGFADPALARCHPFAALAECIHQVPQADFRRLAGDASAGLWLHLLPGLAADSLRAYKKGESGLTRTRFSFSNGGSGKALLKDWRTNLTLVRRAVPAAPGLLGFSLDPEPVTGLMWDPAEQREYALRWQDPAAEPTYSVPILNALALVGLSFLPVLPATGGERTVGFTPDGKAFVWALWLPPLTSPTVTAVLAAAPEQQVPARGVFARLGSSVLSANKRNFFAPSRPV